MAQTNSATATATAPKSKRSAKKAKAEKEPKPEKTPYIESDAAKAILDDDGHLTQAPVDFDPKLHRAPGKKDFAAEDVYLEWSAEQDSQKAAMLVARANSKREQADLFRKHGDPAKRKLVKRREKLLAQLAAVDETLASEGIE